MRHSLLIAALPALLILLTVGPQPTWASQTQTVSVDYAIGMLQAGMDQQAIVKSILDRGVTFTIEPGDLDRLRAAGAGDLLVQTVERQSEAVEETPSSEGEEGAAGPEAGGPGPAQRPRRMNQGDESARPQGQEFDACDIYYCPGDYASAYDYPGYYPYYYPYYYYPGFYAGFYYPFYYPYYGHYGHSGHHHQGRISPRGSPRGQPGATPHGGQVSPRGSPRGGSAGAPSNRGSAAPSHPRSPRGGHR